MPSIPVVYVVDDQADYRFIIQQIFQHYLSAYPVRFFESGRAMLAELAQANPKPRLIFLDRHMPEFDGHQTLLALKHHPADKHIAVVMLSAQASGVEIEGCYEAGASSFIKKQLDFQLLRESLHTACQYWLEINQMPIEVE